jgi:hypothetical protein
MTPIGAGGTVIRFLKFLRTFLNKNFEDINKILFGLAVIVQLMGFVPLLAGFMDHRSVIEAHDNDAGKMVEVGLRSRWYNDNGFRYYGPVYFRIANTFHQITKAYSGKYEAESPEANEESLHFYLILTSLLGAFLIAFSCSLLLSQRWELRFLYILFIVPLLLQSPTWSSYIFTAHPDMLLTGLVAFSTYLTLQMFRSDFEDKKIKWAGYAWGITLSTKLSSLFFMPGIGLLIWLYSKIHHQTWNRVKRFTLSALLSYFLIGFPQNFDIPGSLKKLFRLSEFSSGFSWAGFTDWWSMIANQSWMTLVFIIISSLVFSAGPKDGINVKKRLVLFCALNIGILLLTSRTLELAHTYYAMPFIGVLCVSTVFLFSNLRVGKLPERWPDPIYMQSLLFLVFVAASTTHLFSFPEATVVQRKMLLCRPGFQSVYNMTKAYLQEGGKIISTPYTPVPLEDEEKVSVNWEMNFDTLEKSQVRRMIFNNSYYGRYTQDGTPSKYVQLTNSEWQKSQEFYSAFNGKNEVHTDKAGTWQKVYSDKCSLEIWDKKPES